LRGQVSPWLLYRRFHEKQIRFIEEIGNRNLKLYPTPNVRHNTGFAGAKEIRVESIKALMIIKAI
jgi:hypothetical protein